MGRRARTKGRAGRLRAPDAEYEGADGDRLVLRGSMSPMTRRGYEDVRTDQGASTEDSWHRSVEFLFERLAVRWDVSGVPTEGQAELLARFRVASPAERAWIRDVLREHLAEHFGELRAP
jgi:hypothetical protein